MTDKNIIVAGGGWAGLSCAIRLKQAGHEVQIIEASAQLGGRARGAKFVGYDIDNGQHILVGACAETLDLFDLLDIQEQDALLRKSLSLQLFAQGKKAISLQAKKIPAPFHLLLALLTAKGFSYFDKWLLTRCLVHFNFINFKLKTDQALEQLLLKQKQTRHLINSFWKPLCLAILNTPIHLASAELFLTVLQQSFTQSRQFSDLLLFKKPLNELLPYYAQQYLKPQSIYLSSKITELIIKDNQIKALKVHTNKKEEIIDCDQLVLATPLQVSQQLLSQHAYNKGIDKLLQQLAQFSFQPIYTIYLQYEKNFQLPEIMTGFIEQYTHWVFDRYFMAQPGLLAVVISGHGSHEALNTQQLISLVDNELRQVYTMPSLIKGVVCKEKRATFSACVGVNNFRPESKTTVKGLFLAGDYTQTLYPATLEGAILSGKQAALELQNFLSARKINV